MSFLFKYSKMSQQLCGSGTKFKTTCPKLSGFLGDSLLSALDII